METPSSNTDTWRVGCFDEAGGVGLVTHGVGQYPVYVRTAYNSGEDVCQTTVSSNQNWLRLVRNGNNFLGYASSDGISWDLKFSRTVVMESCIEVGMTLTSSTSTGDHLALFEQVRFQTNLPLSFLQQGENQDELQLSNNNRTFIAYPSPTSGLATVSLNGYIDQKGTLDVVNSFGQILITRQLGWIESSKHDLDLSSLPGGIYTIRLLLETGEAEMIQIVKQ